MSVCVHVTLFLYKVLFINIEKIKIRKKKNFILQNFGKIVGTTGMMQVREKLSAVESYVNNRNIYIHIHICTYTMYYTSLLKQIFSVCRTLFFTQI